MLIETYNKVKSPIEKKKVDKLINAAIDFLLEKAELKRSSFAELSIAFVDKKEIRKLNCQYRGKDETTDVLSFSYGKGLNGEIVLCYGIIKENSHEDGTDVELELGRNIIHGMLHILGYEHGEEMFKLQNSFISKLQT